jgi:hypothetical protein
MNKVQYRVWPRTKKVRYYRNLETAIVDFDYDDLIESTISLIINSSIVATFTSSQVKCIVHELSGRLGEIEDKLYDYYEEEQND